jgi:hypothetical protein
MLSKVAVFCNLNCVALMKPFRAERRTGSIIIIARRASER